MKLNIVNTIAICCIGIFITIIIDNMIKGPMKMTYTVTAVSMHLITLEPTSEIVSMNIIVTTPVIQYTTTLDNTYAKKGIMNFVSLNLSDSIVHIEGHISINFIIDIYPINNKHIPNTK
ncbi:hypothetical protein HJI11_12150 (plasmid) [Staphylococcus epidermidis]|nr:hypothetical protein [Staphylococcus epidermidis]MBM6223806.1 hypothetical protein [Staphylococcus epidermidis]QRJ00918.1 hypothetical protein HJI11_12150 [Staphylococcus epidermidis]